MGELLTTGQMIDRLKVGQIAEIVECKYNTRFHRTKVKRNNSGHLVYSEKLPHKWDDTPIQMTDLVFKCKWRILPDYVSFEEAMQAVREGKQVAYHVRRDHSIIIDSTTFVQIFEEEDGLTFSDLLMDGWTIQD